MRVSSGLPLAANGDANGWRWRASLPARAARRLHAIESIGHRVPRVPFAGRVHSVFARACNIEWRDTLLTLCTAGGAPGPAVLLLAKGGPADLRALVDAGERVQGDGRWLRTDRVELDGSDAAVWHPPAPRPLQPPRQLAANLGRLRMRLGAQRGTLPSIVDGDAAACVAALAEACRALDAVAAVGHVQRLVGWGEGLTPAGDDVLLGVLAGLDTAAFDDAGRADFRRALRDAIAAQTGRTTLISACQLRLAAGGHHAEPLLRMRDALLSDDDPERVDAAIAHALAIGATSGAAALAGLLAALRAWLPGLPGTAREAA